MRGGGWDLAPSSARVGLRYSWVGNGPFSANELIGFRRAIDAP